MSDNTSNAVLDLGISDPNAEPLVRFQEGSSITFLITQRPLVQECRWNADEQRFVTAPRQDGQTTKRYLFGVFDTGSRVQRAMPLDHSTASVLAKLYAQHGPDGVYEVARGIKTSRGGRVVNAKFLAGFVGHANEELRRQATESTPVNLRQFMATSSTGDAIMSLVGRVIE